MAPKSLKTNYGVHHQVESFFTGNHIEFDQSGEHFFCAHGSTINKVCVTDGQIKAQITAARDDDDDYCLRFTLTPDDQLLIAAYQSGLIKKYNLPTQTVDREFRSIHTAPIAYLKTNASSELLATGSADGTIKLWNLINHYCSHNLRGINGVVSCIEFFKDESGELLFAAAGDDSIHVFDLATSGRVAKLKTHASTITGLAFTGTNDNLLVSVGRDKLAVIWDISRGEKFGAIRRTIPLFESVESVIVVSSETFKGPLGTFKTATQDFFATVGEEGTIKIWDPISGSLALTQNVPPMSADRNPGKQCLQLLARPACDLETENRQQQLCAVSVERDIFIYDLPRLDLVQQLQGHLDEVLSACWFANNSYVAIACNSCDLKIMQVATSQCQHLKGHSDIVLCVKPFISEPLMIVSSSKDCTILVWRFESEAMTPQIVYRGTGHTHAVYSLSLPSDNSFIFSGGEDTTLKKWSFPGDTLRYSTSDKQTQEVDTNQLVASQTIKAHEDRVDDITISPNDQLVATGSRDKTAKIFSVEGLKLVATLKGHRRGVRAVRFSPVDQVIVTAADVNLRMWNLHDFSCIKAFQGHDCAVLNFTFLSSGLQLLSVGSDGNMKLWNCKTNECTRTIDAHSGNTWSLAMTEDDRFVITGGQDQKLLIWRDFTEEERETRTANLQERITQEQDFMNYINKKKWRKALRLAIKLENPSKALSVTREVLLERGGHDELSNVLQKLDLNQLNFIMECCVSWSTSAKTSAVGQQALGVILRHLECANRLPALGASMEKLQSLTEKTFNRYERLVQQAMFVDFFLGSYRVQADIASAD